MRGSRGRPRTRTPRAAGRNRIAAAPRARRDHRRAPRRSTRRRREHRGPRRPWAAGSARCGSSRLAQPGWKGYVPVAARALERRPWLAEALLARHVALFVESGAQPVRAVAAFIARLGAASARRHVLIKFGRAEPGPGAVQVDRMGWHDHAGDALPRSGRGPVSGGSARRNSSCGRASGSAGRVAARDTTWPRGQARRRSSASRARSTSPQPPLQSVRSRSVASVRLCRVRRRGRSGWRRAGVMLPQSGRWIAQSGRSKDASDPWMPRGARWRLDGFFGIAAETPKRRSSSSTPER